MTINIVLVDDDTASLEIAQEFLKRENPEISITPVSSAHIALEIMKTTSFDIIISDYQMTDMDGLELLASIRGNDDETPFILWTGRGREEVAIEALNLGANHYIKKEGPPRIHYRELAHIIKSSVEHRRAKAALQDSIERFQLLEKNITDAIITMNLDGIITYVSPSIESLLGYSIDDLLGRSFDMLISDELQKESLRRIESAKSGSTSKIKENLRTLTLEISKKHKGVAFVEVKTSFIRETTGEVIGLVSVLRDVSDRVESQIAISESEEKLRTVVENTIQGIAISRWNPPRIIYANPALCKILGYSEAELLNMGQEEISNLFSSVEREKAIQRAKERIAGEIQNPKPDGPSKLYNKTGDEILVQTYIRRIILDGSPALLSFVTDVTEEYQTERALEASEQKYRSLVEESQQGLLILAHPHYDVVYANKQLAEYMDYSVEEIESMSPQEVLSLIHPEDRKMVAEVFPDNADAEINQTRFDARGIRKDGSVVWFDIKTTPIQYEGEKAIQITYVDITNRKKLEEAHEREIRAFRIIAEAAVMDTSVPDLCHHAIASIIEGLDFDVGVVALYNDDRKELNPTAVYGLTPQQTDRFVINWNIYEDNDIIARVAREKEELLTQDVRNEDYYKAHYRVLDGIEVRAMLMHPIIGTKDQLIGVLGVAAKTPRVLTEDNTLFFNTVSEMLASALEKKFAEIALENSERKYRALIEKAPQGIVLLDKDGIILINQAMGEIVGLKNDERNKQTIEQGFALIHPDDLEEAMQLFTDAQEPDFTESFSNLRFLLRDGSIRYVEAFTTAIEYEGREAIQVILLDESERRKAEEARKREQSAFRIIAEAALRPTTHWEVANRILEGLVNSLGFDMGIFADIEPAVNLIKPTVIIGLSESERSKWLTDIQLDDPESIIAYVARTGDFDFIEDARSHNLYQKHKEEVDTLGFRSIVTMAIPDTKGEIISVIQLVARSKLTLSQSEKRFFSTVCRMAGNVLEGVHSEELLKDSEAKIRQVLDISPDAVFMIDLNGFFLLLNRTTLKFYGVLDESELLGKSVTEIMKEEEVGYTEEALESIKETGFLRDLQFTLVRRDGTTFPVEVNASLLHDIDGEPTAIIATARDTTERLRAEEERKRHQRELEIYASLLQHDLGNDLQLIMNYASLAENHIGGSNPEAQENLESLSGVTQRIGNLLKKFGSSQIIEEKKIGTILERIAAQARLAHPEMEIMVEFEQDVGETEVMSGRLLPMVFENLIRNSAEHAGNSVRVNISAEKTDRLVKIIVHDDGPGIPPDIIGRLFQKGVSSGSGGLGLHLAQSILTAYNGTIYLDSENTQGAKFIVEIPTLHSSVEQEY